MINDLAISFDILVLSADLSLLTNFKLYFLGNGTEYPKPAHAGTNRGRAADGAAKELPGAEPIADADSTLQSAAYRRSNQQSESGKDLSLGYLLIIVKKSTLILII